MVIAITAFLAVVDSIPVHVMFVQAIQILLLSEFFSFFFWICMVCIMCFRTADTPLFTGKRIFKIASVVIEMSPFMQINILYLYNISNGYITVGVFLDGLELAILPPTQRVVTILVGGGFVLCSVLGSVFGSERRARTANVSRIRIINVAVSPLRVVPGL